MSPNAPSPAAAGDAFRVVGLEALATPSAESTPLEEKVAQLEAEAKATAAATIARLEAQLSRSEMRVAWLERCLLVVSAVAVGTGLAAVLHVKASSMMARS